MFYRPALGQTNMQKTFAKQQKINVEGMVKLFQDSFKVISI